MDLRHEHLPRREAELTAALADVIADRRLGDVSAVLSTSALTLLQDPG